MVVKQDTGRSRFPVAAAVIAFPPPFGFRRLWHRRASGAICLLQNPNRSAGWSDPNKQSEVVAVVRIMKKPPASAAVRR